MGRTRSHRPPHLLLHVMTDILEAMETGGILDNRTNIVRALRQIGVDTAVGFDLATCCAIFLMETGGMNYWGHDAWNQSEYPKGIARPADAGNVLVTQGAYQEYVKNRNIGMQPQGCGPGQLTSASLQAAADKAGGCWRPYPNILVSMRYLKSCMGLGGSAFEGFYHYNGAKTYAYTAMSHADHFQELFNA